MECLLHNKYEHVQHDRNEERQEREQVNAGEEGEGNVVVEVGENLEERITVKRRE